MRVRWYARAKNDRRSQIRYIAEHNPTAAVEQDLLIGRAAGRLGLYPELGKIGRTENTRELVISGSPFIAIYRIDYQANEIQIIRILHARQKYPPTKPQ